MAKITDVIKFEGFDENTGVVDAFIWKHPCEDFNSLTQLIVHEGQEAIFFMNGQALDLFGPGRYTLESQNLPILGGIINRVTGGESPFHCEVYFINKTVQMAVKWGTDSRVRFIDPITDVPLDIGASGEMNLQVCDSRKLLVKLVGTKKGISGEPKTNDFGQLKDRNGVYVDKEAFRADYAKNVIDSFRPHISTAVKTNLASAIKQSNIDILEIDAHLEMLSGILREKIVTGFEEYGLTVPQLYITTISLPENDKNFQSIRELRSVSLKKRMIEATADITAAQRQVTIEEELTKTELAKHEAERQIIGAQAKAQAEKMQGFAEAEVYAAKGITEKDYVQAEVQKEFAKGMGNMGSNGGSGGSVMSDVVGLGIGLQAAGAMNGQLGGMFNGIGMAPVAGVPASSVAQQQSIQCANCGNSLPANAKFCLECGTKVENLSADEIICPECGKKTARGKFCMECGASLVHKCEKCGAEIPNGAKFCSECGEKV